MSVSPIQDKHQPRLIMPGGTAITLPPGDQWIVGRLTESSVTVSVDLSRYDGWESGVSRQHICIRRTSEGYTIEDLGSRHETLINADRLAMGQQYPLTHGDQLTLGKWRGVFVIE